MTTLYSRPAFFSTLRVLDQPGLCPEDTLQRLGPTKTVLGLLPKTAPWLMGLRTGRHTSPLARQLIQQKASEATALLRELLPNDKSFTADQLARRALRHPALQMGCPLRDGVLACATPDLPIFMHPPVILGGVFSFAGSIPRTLEYAWALQLNTTNCPHPYQVFGLAVGDAQITSHTVPAGVFGASFQVSQRFAEPNTVHLRGSVGKPGYADACYVHEDDGQRLLMSARAYGRGGVQYRYSELASVSPSDFHSAARFEAKHATVLERRFESDMMVVRDSAEGLLDLSAPVEMDSSQFVYVPGHVIQITGLKGRLSLYQLNALVALCWNATKSLHQSQSKPGQVVAFLLDQPWQYAADSAVFTHLTAAMHHDSSKGLHRPTSQASPLATLRLTSHHHSDALVMNIFPVGAENHAVLSRYIHRGFRVAVGAPPLSQMAQ